MIQLLLSMWPRDDWLKIFKKAGMDKFFSTKTGRNFFFEID